MPLSRRCFWFLFLLGCFLSVCFSLLPASSGRSRNANITTAAASALGDAPSRCARSPVRLVNPPPPHPRPQLTRRVVARRTTVTEVQRETTVHETSSCRCCRRADGIATCGLSCLHTQRIHSCTRCTPAQHAVHAPGTRAQRAVHAPAPARAALCTRRLQRAPHNARAAPCTRQVS